MRARPLRVLVIAAVVGAVTMLASASPASAKEWDGWYFDKVQFKNNVWSPIGKGPFKDYLDSKDPKQVGIWDGEGTRPKDTARYLVRVPHLQPGHCRKVGDTFPSIAADQGSILQNLTEMEVTEVVLELPAGDTFKNVKTGEGITAKTDKNVLTVTFDPPLKPREWVWMKFLQKFEKADGIKGRLTCKEVPKNEEEECSVSFDSVPASTVAPIVARTDADVASALADVSLGDVVVRALVPIDEPEVGDGDVGLPLLDETEVGEDAPPDTDYLPPAVDICAV